MRIIRLSIKTETTDSAAKLNEDIDNYYFESVEIVDLPDQSLYSADPTWVDIGLMIGGAVVSTAVQEITNLIKKAASKRNEVILSYADVKVTVETKDEELVYKLIETLVAHLKEEEK
ncbi:MAG: hypothetical protein AAFN93_01805 [Bacteroidota bacterium]